MVAIMEFAVGIIVGMAICGAIPRIAIGIYSGLKKKEYRLIDITNNTKD